MRTIILSREGTDYARPVSEFIEMFRRKYPDRKVEMVDLDSREGADSARMYGITRYPGIIVYANDGRVVQTWEGMPIPLIDEVAAFALG